MVRKFRMEQRIRIVPETYLDYEDETRVKDYVETAQVPSSVEVEQNYKVSVPFTETKMETFTRQRTVRRRDHQTVSNQSSGSARSDQDLQRQVALP